MTEQIRMIDLSGLGPGEFSGVTNGGIGQPAPQTDGTITIIDIDMSDYLLRTGGTRFDPRPIGAVGKTLGEE